MSVRLRPLSEHFSSASLPKTPSLANAVVNCLSCVSPFPGFSSKILSTGSSFGGVEKGG